MRRVIDTSLDTSSGDASNNQKLATLPKLAKTAIHMYVFILSHDAFTSL